MAQDDDGPWGESWQKSVLNCNNRYEYETGPFLWALSMERQGAWSGRSATKYLGWEMGVTTPVGAAVCDGRKHS